LQVYQNINAENLIHHSDKQEKHLAPVINIHDMFRCKYSHEPNVVSYNGKQIITSWKKNHKGKIKSKALTCKNLI